MPQPYGEVTVDGEVMDLDGGVMDLDGEVTVDGEGVDLDGEVTDTDTDGGGRGRRNTYLLLWYY
jgi:hypothetical protein